MPSFGLHHTDTLDNDCDISLTPAKPPLRGHVLTFNQMGCTLSIHGLTPAHLERITDLGRAALVAHGADAAMSEHKTCAEPDCTLPAIESFGPYQHCEKHRMPF